MIRSTTALSFALLAGSSAAFRAVAPATSARGGPLASYLDQLSEASAGARESSWGSWAPSPEAAAEAAAPEIPDSDPSIGGGIHHAPLGFFSLDKLVSKGPRATKDWGSPQDGTRKLADDGMLRGGSWYCSEGGWPSPNQKAHTEIFYVLEGHGMLGDSDGAKHYFGPGDTVIIPKGHTGRWDVHTPIHKIWAVNAHDAIEEDTSSPIRVVVEGYHSFAPHNLTPNNSNGGFVDPVYGSDSASIAYNTFYDVGPTSVGVWAAGAGSIAVGAPLERKTFFHLLEGILYVHDAATGTAKRCVPGDTVMLPAGFTGHVDVIEPAKKLFTTAV
mmetsp:Transcript_30407/g.63745  ORF Transcript_30407/g.63745 Transcript_30407/m.63745 type:complete len:329 (+) Transcript_30407:299-1285(+)